MCFKKLLCLVLLIAGLQACSSSGGALGGTETGSTDAGEIDTSTLGTRIETVSSALVLNIPAENISASLSPSLRALTYNAGSDWSTYLAPANSNVLTDVFGNADEDPQVVTKIRVLLENFNNTLTNIFERDADITCVGGTALSEGALIDIAYYGSIDNGSGTDKNFDCLTTEGDSDEETIIYGKDADNVIRIVQMYDSTQTNTESTDTRGNQVRVSSVVSATYSEQTESESTIAYLDLQYNQATSYNGADVTYNTDDDVSFKSRSRISGRVTLDSAGEASNGQGEFVVTKFDAQPDNDSNPMTITTKTMGRGTFGASEYVLFKINSDASTLPGTDQAFCIQLPSADTGLPSSAESSNCTALETGFAWTSATFPFDLTPGLSANFDDILFYEADDTDLISDSRDNFTIPTY